MTILDTQLSFGMLRGLKISVLICFNEYKLYHAKMLDNYVKYSILVFKTHQKLNVTKISLHMKHK